MQLSPHAFPVVHVLQQTPLAFGPQLVGVPTAKESGMVTTRSVKNLRIRVFIFYLLRFD